MNVSMNIYIYICRYGHVPEIGGHFPRGRGFGGNRVVGPYPFFVFFMAV